MARIDYDKLEEVYETEGRSGATKYLKALGIKLPEAALKKMRDRQMERNTINEDAFLSLEELCEKSQKTPNTPNVPNAQRVHEMNGEHISQFPEINGDKIMIELLLDKIQDYNRFFMIDRSNGIVHIDKSRLVNAGFEIFMY